MAGWVAGFWVDAFVPAREPAQWRVRVVGSERVPLATASLQWHVLDGLALGRSRGVWDTFPRARDVAVSLAGELRARRR